MAPPRAYTRRRPFLPGDPPVTRLLAAILALVALAPAIARGQAVSGSVRGRVIDERGNSLAGVLVRFENLRSGFRYATVTDAHGIYQVDFLLPSLYAITASKDGFQTGRIDRFQAEVASTKEIIPPPITLERLVPAATASAPAGSTVRDQVETGTTELQFHISAETAARLPLRGFRGFDELALLAPGVARPPETAGARGPGVGPGVGTAGSFSVHGSRARANDFTWDGADNTDQDVGTRRQGFLLPGPVATESVSAFELTTLLPSATAGRATGGTVNAVTRAGENRASGEAYAFGTGRPLAARDPFDTEGPGNPAHNPFARAQFGILGQAPIVSERMHAFASIERLRLSDVRDVHFAVPTTGDRADAFARARVASPLGRDILLSGLVPLPNDPSGPRGANTLTRALDASGSGWIGAAKIDAQFPFAGRLATVAVRFAGTSDVSRIPAVDEALSSELDATSSTANVASSLQMPLGDRAAFEGRASWGRSRVAFDEVPGSPQVFSSPAGLTGPVGRLRLDPFSPVGVDPASFAQNRLGETTAFAGIFAVRRGEHDVRFGADLRLLRFAGRLDRSFRAEMEFSPGLSYNVGKLPKSANGLVFAAIGLATNIYQALATSPDSYLDLRTHDVAVFVDDRWRVRAGLLVTLGLRYGYTSPPRSDGGVLERRLATTLSDVRGYDPEDVLDAEFGIRYSAYERHLAGRTTIYEPDRNNFGPRIGVVWDPSRQGTIAVRGGYALVYDAPLGTVVTQSRNTFPAYVPLNFGLSALFPDLLTRNPALLPGPVVVPGTVNTLNGGPEDLPNVLGGLFFVYDAALAFTLPERRLRSPYVHQWSAGIDGLLPGRSRASVRYVGTAGRKLTRLTLPNGGPSTTARYIPKGRWITPRFFQSLRPEPDLGAYEEFRSDASSTYHGLEVVAESSPLDGLEVRAAWTLSQASDDVSDVFATSGALPFGQDELDRSRRHRPERGRASFDVRHRFVGTAVYRPAWRWHGVLDGTTFAGVVELSSGQPFTVTSSLDANLDGVLADRPVSAAGFDRIASGPRVLAIAPGVDALSIVLPSGSDAGAFRSLDRNTFRGRGIATVDLAASKSFAIGRHRLEFRVEVFNALNHPNYGLPIRVLEAPGFGASIATSVPSRTVQFGLRAGF